MEGLARALIPGGVSPLHKDADELGISEAPAGPDLTNLLTF